MLHPNDTDFALKFKNARKSQKLTQEELAKKLGVTRLTIIKWEKGQTVPTQQKHVVQINEIFKTEEPVIEKIDLTNVKIEDMFNEIKRRGFSVTYTM